MGNAAKSTRYNRILTVDFHDETTAVALLDTTKAFGEFVLAFLLSIGFQLHHKSTCNGGGSLTRHSHDMRIRLGELPIWRMPCTRGKAVFTVLPHFVLRYRTMRPDVARDALLATHGGLSLAWCAMICPISPMALYRVICAFGQPRFVAGLTRCGLRLPAYRRADDKHRRCLTDKVSLPTIVSGRVLWHLGDNDAKSAAAFTPSYGMFQQAALAQEPSYRVQGARTDGFDSTVRSRRTVLPGAPLGFCLRHALNKLPRTLIGVSASVRQGLRAKFHALRHRGRQRPSLRVVALGQRLRHCADSIATTVGADHGERVRPWFQDKKAGWYTVLADPRMPASSPLLDQAHTAMDRKLFAMQGFHHPGGRPAVFLTGLAHLYNLLPSQRRALHAGQWGGAVEGGRFPTQDWMLNLPILTSGGAMSA